MPLRGRWFTNLRGTTAAISSFHNFLTSTWQARRQIALHTDRVAAVLESYVLCLGQFGPRILIGGNHEWNNAGGGQTGGRARS